MKIRRNSKLLVEPPSAATGDIAFNLIVFFLVCASTQPDTGRKQTLPKADKTQQQEQQQNVEVTITRQVQSINGTPHKERDFVPRLLTLLSGKTKPEDRIVVVKNTKDVPWERFVQVTGWMREAGVDFTLQREEERTVVAE
jgi:biopolymer transport protein ExbD